MIPLHLIHLSLRILRSPRDLFFFQLFSRSKLLCCFSNLPLKNRTAIGGVVCTEKAIHVS